VADAIVPQAKNIECVGGSKNTMFEFVLFGKN
jgi:hypothetical protein